jgi:hypothetical protein
MASSGATRSQGGKLPRPITLLFFFTDNRHILPQCAIKTKKGMNLS